jgi:hypothetical protein
MVHVSTNGEDSAETLHLLKPLKSLNTLERAIVARYLFTTASNVSVAKFFTNPKDEDESKDNSKDEPEDDDDDESDEPHDEYKKDVLEFLRDVIPIIPNGDEDVWKDAIRHTQQEWESIYDKYANEQIGWDRHDTFVNIRTKAECYHITMSTF